MSKCCWIRVVLSRTVGLKISTGSALLLSFDLLAVSEESAVYFFTDR